MSEHNATHQFSIDLGRHVVRLCQERGINRSTLVRRSGLSLEEVRRIEEGWGGASLLMLRKVAGALRVSMGELFDERSWRD